MTVARQLVALVSVALALGGCSTPGPLHLYSIAPAAQTVHDVAIDSRDVARDIPSYLAAADQLTGFAYDPYTDHFFLRLAPGNHIRVVDRPARKLKLEFVIQQVPGDGGGDLAVSPRTGHLYLVDPSAPAISVTTRLGEYLDRIALDGRTAPAAAIAFDMAADQLVVLDNDGRTIDRYTLAGDHVGSIALARAVKPSLAYDHDARQVYAPLADEPNQVGVFDTTGHLVRTVAIASGDQFIDVGPHSFLRIF